MSASIVRPRFSHPFGALLATALAAGSDGIPAAELVSVNAAATNSGNGASYSARLSADGRYVLLASVASDLVTGVVDGNGVEDLFRRDLRTGVTALISAVPSGNATGNGRSQFATISADGRWVAFTSTATDLTMQNDSNMVNDVFLRDAELGTTIRLSSNLANNDSGNLQSQSATISHDGGIVVFVTSATNLGVLPDDNGSEDLYVYNRVNATRALVSVNIEGTATANGYSSGTVCLSRDARYLAFTSSASNLTASGGGGQDVYRRDLQDNVTALVSSDSGGVTSGNGTSIITFGRCMSDDGRFITFNSRATNLSPLDTGSDADIYVRDMQTTNVELISINSAGTAGGAGDANTTSISANANRVTFRSAETDLVTGGSAGFQIFQRDRQAGTTRLITRALSGGSSNASFPVSMDVSPDGRRVAFSSNATDLVAISDGNGERDAFVWDAGSDRITMLSRVANGSAAGDLLSVEAVPGADGSVAFVSRATNLVVGDGNALNDAFVDRSHVFSDSFQ